MVDFGNDWNDVMSGEFDKPYYRQLRSFLKNEYMTKTVFPDMHCIFNAQKFTPYSRVRAVILGQDPYHGRGQAHGLCFSVQRGTEMPPSLVNIFRELNSDTGCPVPDCGDLTGWAKSGVLLLNSVLTVLEGRAGSHSGKGWETYTDEVIRKVNEKDSPVVFLLWGNYAKKKSSLVTNSRHLVLTAAHPSPLSAYNGFFGCRHFSAANRFLESHGEEPINWDLSE